MPFVHSVTAAAYLAAGAAAVAVIAKGAWHRRTEKHPPSVPDSGVVLAVFVLALAAFRVWALLREDCDTTGDQGLHPSLLATVCAQRHLRMADQRGVAACRRLRQLPGLPGRCALCSATAYTCCRCDCAFCMPTPLLT